MLTLLQNASPSDRHRLGVAIAHLEAAISHINNEAQCHVPLTPQEESEDVEDLRLIVRALADIAEALRSMRGAARTET
jgi:hypothetical protein